MSDVSLTAYIEAVPDGNVNFQPLSPMTRPSCSYEVNASCYSCEAAPSADSPLGRIVWNFNGNDVGETRQQIGWNV